MKESNGRLYVYSNANDHLNIILARGDGRGPVQNFEAVRDVNIQEGILAELNREC